MGGSPGLQFKLTYLNCLVTDSENFLQIIFKKNKEFAHLPICPFAHFNICPFAHSQICTFANYFFTYISTHACAEGFLGAGKLSTFR
jgi:hypothetical protein